MKTRSLASLVLVLLLFPPGISHAQETWEFVAPGIEYREVRLPDPNRVYVARMDRHYQDPTGKLGVDLTIDSGLANGELGGGLEDTSQIARRYDQAINYWDGQAWGARNHVAVAINGSYVDKTGWPVSGQIISGWYAKRFDENGGGSGFAWKMDRTAFIGGCVDHDPNKQYVQVLDTGQKLLIDSVNMIRQPEGLFLYTPQWGANTGTLDVGVEVLVELERPAMVYPGDRLTIPGIVREVRDRKGSTFIPYDAVVLSARGAARDRLLAALKPGARVGINQEITHYQRDCRTKHPASWTTAYASVSGDYVFLENGQIRSYDNAGAVNRHPRTAIAYNDQYIYFIVVDGRQPEVSIGMTIDELAVFTRDALAAAWGIALDGGGSSTMVVDGVVKNRPSVPCNRVYLPVTNAGSPPGEIEPPPDGVPRQPTACERAVANAMMMIVVEPKEQSAAFSVGDRVESMVEAELRLGPGTNYASLATVPAGVAGTIVADLNQLDGVFAKGSYWWKVAFGSAVGWFPQEALGQQRSTFFNWFMPR